MSLEKSLPSGRMRNEKIPVGSDYKELKLQF